MVYVSVSAFDEADLLDGCLRAVRDALPDATVEVIDGAYSTFPRENDASTDATADVCARHDARYHVPTDLPFEQEVDKHRYRVDLAPDGERALFLDADERLVSYDTDALDADTAYAVRIYNPLVYSESPLRYWPRAFDPANVLEVSRWDKYLFDVACDRTDAVTIAHRHDLRDREYRERKYERFQNEGRDGRYADDRFEQYLTNDWDVATGRCRPCGADALTASPPTAEGVETYTAVEVCLACDYTAVREYPLNGYEYLPDDWERGMAEDPERLRVELMDAGCPFVAMLDFTTAATADRLHELKPSVRVWVEDTFERETPRVFDGS